MYYGSEIRTSLLLFQTKPLHMLGTKTHKTASVYTGGECQMRLLSEKVRIQDLTRVVFHVMPVVPVSSHLPPPPI